MSIDTLFDWLSGCFGIIACPVVWVWALCYLIASTIRDAHIAYQQWWEKRQEKRSDDR